MTLSVFDIAHALSHGKEVKVGDHSYNAVCPAHDDGGPSLSITQSDEKLLVKCHAGCTQDAVISALVALGLWESKGQQWKVLAYAPDEKGKPTGMLHPKFGAPSRRWEYRDHLGRLVGYVYRFDTEGGGKEIVPLAWCISENGSHTMWRWKSFLRPRPLYQGHLLRQHRDKTVLIVEGEKTCDAAQKIFADHLIVTFPGGTGAVKMANWEVLKDRDCIIWMDADEPGKKCSARLAEILISIKAKNVRQVILPESLPEGWDLADEPPDGVDVQTILRDARAFVPSGDPMIDQLNIELSLALVGDKAVVIRERWDAKLKRAVPTYLALGAIRTFYANKTIMVGRHNVNVIDHWLQHPGRRSYDSVVFEPGRDLPGSYNLWRGFAYDPDPTGEWGLLDDHLRQNIAQGDDSLYNWILAWFAQMLQNPQRKPGTSIAIRGKLGSGKTVVGEHMGALIRDNYVTVDDARYVTGQFNSHMSHALLLQADEGFFAGDPRHVGRLKGLVTSATNRIELKGKDSFEISNYLRLLITSNERWVIPAALEERRFAMFDCGNGRLQDTRFFAAMRQQLENGGYEGLLHHLLTLDISTVDLQQLPKTQALMDQKEQTLDPVKRFWFERLQDGELWPGAGRWENVVSIEALYQAYLKRAMSWGIPRRASESQFGKELKELMPNENLDRVRRTVATYENGGAENRRTWCYQLPSLEEGRAAFQAALGSEVGWIMDLDPQPQLTNGKLNGHEVL